MRDQKLKRSRYEEKLKRSPQKHEEERAPLTFAPRHHAGHIDCPAVYPVRYSLSMQAIVTTTIFVPRLLTKYASDAKAHRHNPLFVVIGDKKTPLETAVFCASLAKKSGFAVEYFSPERQDDYLKKSPSLKKWVGERVEQPKKPS